MKTRLYKVHPVRQLVRRYIDPDAIYCRAQNPSLASEAAADMLDEMWKGSSRIHDEFEVYEIAEPDDGKAGVCVVKDSVILVKLENRKPCNAGLSTKP